MDAGTTPKKMVRRRSSNKVVKLTHTSTPHTFLHKKKGKHRQLNVFFSTNADAPTGRQLLLRGTTRSTDYGIFFAVMASTDFRKGSSGFRRGSYGFRRGSYGFWDFGYVGGFTVLCLTGFLLP